MTTTSQGADDTRVINELKVPDTRFTYLLRFNLLDGQFDSQWNGALTFAARATSAFPLAFKPAILNEIWPSTTSSSTTTSTTSTSNEADARQQFLDSNFPGEQHQCTSQAFADGGILLNKPFQPIVDALVTTLMKIKIL